RALRRAYCGSRADQLGALLRPHAAISRPDPDGAGGRCGLTGDVVRSADDDGVTVAGDGHRTALVSGSRRARTNELGPLAPNTATSGPDPDSSDPRIIVRRADDGRVAVRGNGDGKTLLTAPHRARAD